MSVTFRISQRFSTNREASKYLKRPAVPTSMSHFKKALETVRGTQLFRAASAIYERPEDDDHGIRATSHFLKPLNRVSDNPYGDRNPKQTDMSALEIFEAENINYDIKSIKTNEYLRVNTTDDKGYAM